ncbi:MAG: hypothetical protein HAW66_05215 [Shewanella sp.]|nr:hypothetical protein [Shewanella sp.]
MLNKKVRAALRIELGNVGHVLAAAAVLAFLAEKIVANTTAMLLTLGFILIGIGLALAENKFDQFVNDLREFRKLQLGAILLAWATSGVSINLAFWVMVFFIVCAFVIEFALLKDD